MNRRRRHRIGGAFFAALLVASIVAAGAAGAHEGPGAITIVEQAQPAPAQVAFTVDIQYALDGDAGSPTSFTVNGIGPDGTAVGPIDLAATGDPGIYSAVVDYPSTGLWTMTFTSDAPPAELVEEVTVGEVDGTATTAADDTDTTTGDETTDETMVANVEDAPTTTVAEEAASLVESEGSGPPAALVAGLVVAGLVVAGGAFWVLRARRDASA